jgi:hypothetical protein
MGTLSPHKRPLHDPPPHEQESVLLGRTDRIGHDVETGDLLEYCFPSWLVVDVHQHKLGKLVGKRKGRMLWMLLLGRR